jgi:hypothetical protein
MLLARLATPASRAQGGPAEDLKRAQRYIQYVAHCDLDREEAFAATSEPGIDRIVSKRLTPRRP